MMGWYDALLLEIFKDPIGAPHLLSLDDWYPETASVQGMENGSMTMEMIGYVINHISLHSKQEPKPNHKVLLLL